MARELERYEEHFPEASTASAESAAPRGNPLNKVAGSIRRHRVMILVIWLVCAIPGSVAVWMLVKPTYVASGSVSIEPTQPILEGLPGDQAQSGMAFDTFVNTQAKTIVSGGILREALADPTLRDLPLLSDRDPLMELRKSLDAGVIPKTHLIRLSVERENEEEARRLAKAILGTYKKHAGGAEQGALQSQKSVLEESQKTFRTAKLGLQEELYAAGKEFGVNIGSIDAMRSSLTTMNQETFKQRDEALAEMKRQESLVKSLERGETPTSMPGDEVAYINQEIREDRTVAGLRSSLADIMTRIAREGATSQLKLQEQRTSDLLKKAEAEAEQKARQKATDWREQKRADQLVRARSELESAKAQYDAFKAQSDKISETLGKMNEVSLKLKKIDDDLKETESQYSVISDALHRIEIESKRPGRVNVDDNVEILPDDRKDRRPKMVLVLVFGTFCFAVGLALVRDLASGRLYTVEDLRSTVGLRLLGALPALDDLRSGKVNESDFRESYRTIRATLAGSSPEGQIPKSLLVTSAQAAEGKTSLAISLAASLAESGCRVLVIDGDVQAPRIAHALRLKSPAQLKDVLLGQRKLTEAVLSTPVAGLDVLLTGRNGHSASGILNRRLAMQVLKSAAERYDHIVVDSPPVLGSADALIWAQVVDGVVISSLAGHSSHRVARQACERLTSVGGRILGAVLCNVTVKEDYHSYSSYSSIKLEEGEDVPPEHAAAHRTPVVYLPPQPNTPKT